jgi:tripartite-type tricarboxylate transporter receptor subunit TctC
MSASDMRDRRFNQCDIPAYRFAHAGYVKMHHAFGRDASNETSSTRKRGRSKSTGGTTMRLPSILTAACLTLGMLASASAQDANYPSRQITLIAPFAAGGTADILARTVSEHLQKKLGATIIVENVTGAGSIVGTARVARATPDGYTIGLASTSAWAINPTLYGAKLSYNPEKELVPVAQISMVPNVLVVNPDRIKARTVPELIEYAKANPGKVTFGSAGVGTTQHLAGELFQQMTGTKMVHVPYKGSSQMVTDLLSGQIDIAFDNVPLLLPHAAAGKLAMLATASLKRADFDPNLPAVSEFLPGFEAVAWHGIMVPTGTPKPIVDRLSTEIRALMKQPETIKKMADLGVVAVAIDGPDFAKYIAEETKRWKVVIEKANITMN